MLTSEEINELQNEIYHSPGKTDLISWWYLEGYEDIIVHGEYSDWMRSNTVEQFKLDAYEMGIADARGDKFDAY